MSPLSKSSETTEAFAKRVLSGEPSFRSDRLFPTEKVLRVGSLVRIFTVPPMALPP